MIGDLNGSFGSRQFLTLQMKREFAEFGSFHVVVLQRTAKKCKRVITHVHSYCSGPGSVVRKPVNANARLKVKTEVLMFCCVKMFFAAYALCGSRLR